MTDFFIQRLSDVQSVPGIFQGLNALLAMDRVTGDWIAKIPQK